MVANRVGQQLLAEQRNEQIQNGAAEIGPFEIVGVEERIGDLMKMIFHAGQPRFQMRAVDHLQIAFFRIDVVCEAMRLRVPTGARFNCTS